jgi:glycosyltransferase involved in cell wall biosynthesis
VSYVTVVRNNDKTLARTIESVLAQTYQNVEHIILDGASTDSTLDVIKSYSETLDYFASEPDAGLYDALNKAIPLAMGSLICVLNADDWLEPDAAAIAVNAATSTSPATLVLSAARVNIGSQLVEWRPTRVTLTSYFTCVNCCHNAIYSTRSSYEISGRYDTNYAIAADFKWIMQCFDAGVIFLYIDRPTVNYSLGGISGDGGTHRQECQQLIKERFDFLEPEEVAGLHYCYYYWRDRLTETDVAASFNPEQFMQGIRKKYVNKTDFLKAADQSSLSKSFFARFKNLVRKKLIKYPWAFALIYKIYKQSSTQK